MIVDKSSKASTRQNSTSLFNNCNWPKKRDKSSQKSIGAQA